MAVLIIFDIAYFTLFATLIISVTLAILGLVGLKNEESIENPCDECNAECENRKDKDND